jgi:hypothetical protein
METVQSPKQWLKLVIHSTKPMKTILIDTAVKVLQKTVVFQYYFFPSMRRLSNSVCTVMELWKSIKHAKNLEDGDSTFSETSVQASTTWYQVQEGIFNWHRRESIPEDCGLPTLKCIVVRWTPVCCLLHKRGQVRFVWSLRPVVRLPIYHTRNYLRTWSSQLNEIQSDLF